MIGRADDALLLCLIAAALVVLAHAVDALGSRRRGDGEGWAASLALALCGLALGILVVGAVLSSSRTDLFLTLATAAAVIVSALPLVRLRTAEEESPRPANPWDRAFRIRRARASQLLSPPGPERPAPEAAMRHRPSTPAPRTPREGIVLPATHLAPDSAELRATPPGHSPTPSPEVHEAEETLHDVSEVVGDLGRLLGLDERDRRG